MQTFKPSSSSQIAAAQEDLERLAAARGAAQAETAQAEAAAQQALEAGHAEVMKLRHKWDELSSCIAGLGRERDALQEEIAQEKSDWSSLHQVGAAGPSVAQQGNSPVPK
jgi:chromosome segregation ATPase